MFATCKYRRTVDVLVAAVQGIAGMAGLLAGARVPNVASMERTIRSVGGRAARVRRTPPPYSGSRSRAATPGSRSPAEWRARALQASIVRVRAWLEPLWECSLQRSRGGSDREPSLELDRVAFGTRVAARTEPSHLTIQLCSFRNDVGLCQHRTPGGEYVEVTARWTIYRLDRLPAKDARLGP